MTKQIFTSKGIWDNGLFIIRIFTGIMIYQHGKELFDSKSLNDLMTQLIIGCFYGSAIKQKGVRFTRNAFYYL